MATIYLIRHGQATAGGENYDELSPLGVQQAMLTGQWLAQHGMAARRVFAGTLQRQQHSARAALQAAGLDAAIATVPGLDELDYLDLLAVWRADFDTPAAVRAWMQRQPDPRKAFQHAFAQAMQQWLQAAPDDAHYRESWPQFQARCVAALAQAMQASAGCDHVWVFSSGGPIAVICQHLLHMRDAGALDLIWHVRNGSITQLHWRGAADAHVLSFNNCAHLEHDAALLTFR